MCLAGCNWVRVVPSWRLATTILGVDGRGWTSLQASSVVVYQLQALSPRHSPPRAVPRMLLRFMRKIVGLSAVVYALTSLTLPPIPHLMVQSEAKVVCREGAGPVRGRGEGMPRGTREARKGQTLPAWPLPHALLIASQIRCTALLPAAYSMYMILSIFSDAAGATVSYVLNLPIAPHFSNPCARVWGR